MADYERTLLLVRECYVYKIPPRASSKGYRAADWDLNAYVWQGRLRIVSVGEQLFIKLEDATSGELFAMCKYRKDDNSVEQVLDSSRYFVIRIENERGQHTFIGLGFLERTTSFDFNVTLQDFEKHMNMEKEAAKRAEEWDKQPKKDFSLKEGQTISIKIGGTTGVKPSAHAAPSSTGAGASFLPPPPRGAAAAAPSAPAAATGAAKQASPWGDFDDFQDASTSSTNSSNNSFSGWTTF